jgi:hypothetical protein
MKNRRKKKLVSEETLHYERVTVDTISEGTMSAAALVLSYAMSDRSPLMCIEYTVSDADPQKMAVVTLHSSPTVLVFDTSSTFISTHVDGTFRISL